MVKLGSWSATRLRILLPLAALAVAMLALTACGGSNAEPAAAASNNSGGSSAAAAPAQASRIYIYADTVIGSKGMTDEEKPLRSCTEQSRFAPGEQIGWRIKVYDAATGAELKDTDVASVQIKLGDGQVLDAKYAGHGKPEPSDFFWANFWVIPDGYPTGLLPYTITATTNDGRTAEFTSTTINITSSQLTIQEKS
jgi:hypothetical protein